MKNSRCSWNTGAPPGNRGSITASIKFKRPVFDFPFRPLGRRRDLYSSYYIRQPSRSEVWIHMRRPLHLFLLQLVIVGKTVAYMWPRKLMSQKETSAARIGGPNGKFQPRAWSEAERESAANRCVRPTWAWTDGVEVPCRSTCNVHVVDKYNY